MFVRIVWTASCFSTELYSDSKKKKSVWYISRLLEMTIPGCFHPSLVLFCVTSIILHAHCSVALFYNKYIVPCFVHRGNQSFKYRWNDEQYSIDYYTTSSYQAWDYFIMHYPSNRKYDDNKISFVCFFFSRISMVHNTFFK